MLTLTTLKSNSSADFLGHESFTDSGYLHSVMDLGPDYGASSISSYICRSGYNYSLLNYLSIDLKNTGGCKEIILHLSPCFREFRGHSADWLHCCGLRGGRTSSCRQSIMGQYCSCPPYLQTPNHLSQ